MAKVLANPSGGEPFQTPAIMISRLYLLKDNVFVRGRLLFQDRRQRGPRVFGIEVQRAAHECLLCQQGAAEVEFAVHYQLRASLELLRQDLAQDDLLGVVFGADH